MDPGSWPAEERAIWTTAVKFYARDLAQRDVRTGTGMTIITGRLSGAGESIGTLGLSSDHQRLLEDVAPVYRRRQWPHDDKANHARHRAAEFGIDGQRLGISGSSAGGLLALVVAMQEQDGDTTSDDVAERESARVQAVGCFFPPTDLLNYGGSAENIVDLMQEAGPKARSHFPVLRPRRQNRRSGINHGEGGRNTDVAGVFSCDACHTWRSANHSDSW